MSIVNRRSFVRLLSLLFLASMFVAAGTFTTGSTAAGKEAAPDGGNGETDKVAEGGDCSSGQTCQEGLECKEGKCAKKAVEPQCKENTDCPPGEECKDQKCVKAVDNNIDKVEIVDGPKTLREGGSGKLTVALYNKAGARIQSGEKVTWKSSADDTVSVGADGTATGGSKDGTANITAEVAGKTSAPWAIRNFAKVTGDNVRVIVRDGAGNPVKDATVMIGSEKGTTDADGVASVKTDKTPFDVHVFAKGYSYFSAFGTSKKDLFVSVGKNPDKTQAGGVVGEFNYDRARELLGISEDDWASYTVGFGLAGFSIPGSLLDLDFSVLLGENIKVSLFGNDVEVPSALFLALGTAGKPKYQVLGNSGKRILWGLGGKYKLTEITKLIPSDTKNLDIGKILAQVGPLFKSLLFGYLQDINVSMKAKVKDTNDINGDGKKDDLVPDFDNFDTKNIILTQKLDQTINVSISKYPEVKDKDGKDVPLYVIGLAGTFLPGYGLVPFGIALGEAKTTKSLEIKHPKLEGILTKGTYVVATLALTLPLGDNPPPLYIAAHLQSSTSAISSVAVSNFVGFGNKATFDPASRKLSNANATGSDTNQLDVSSDDQRWIIVFGKQTEITLPAVPSGFTDAVSADGSASLRAFSLKSGLDLDKVLEFNSDNMDNLNLLITGFSNVTVYEKKK